MFDAIDVSKWQGAMNWAGVKAAGVHHAMLRAGYGNSAVDPQFERNEPSVRRWGWTGAARGMEYTYGLYYSDGGKVYLCKRTGEEEGGTVVLQYLPHELVGQYFEEVKST